ncbi:hypothetical protein ACWWJ3_26075, partial [Klebsiella pneumoniae]
HYPLRNIRICQTVLRRRLRSSGPHLHYELVINNNPVNSLAFRAAAPADNKLEQHAFAHARDYERYLD